MLQGLSGEVKVGGSMSLKAEIKMLKGVLEQAQGPSTSIIEEATGEGEGEGEKDDEDDDDEVPELEEVQEVNILENCQLSASEEVNREGEMAK